MPKFTIGSRINHKYWGHGTVVGNSCGSPVRVPVLYDNQEYGFCDQNYEANMEQIPGPAIYPNLTAVPDGRRALTAAPPTFVHTEADVLESFERGKLSVTANPGLVVRNVFDMERIKRDEREAGYKEGHDAAYASLMAAEFKRAADAAVENAAYHGDAKTGKQLLNELYHDRARLETALQDATKVIDSFMYVLECQRVGDDMDTDTDEGRITLTDEEHISWVYGIGQQFVDTYGDKE